MLLLNLELLIDSENPYVLGGFLLTIMYCKAIII
jgi:hypothetical protein